MTEHGATIEGPLLIPVDEVAKLLSLCVRSVYTLEATGRLGPQQIRLNRRKLYRRSEIIDWITAGLPPRRLWQWRPAK